MIEHVRVFDTTLRDGEQSPGAALQPMERLQIALALCDLGVDIIEAGFPASSDSASRAVNMIAQKIKGVTICALARAIPGDIDAAAQALVGAEKPRIHTFIATSPIHMEHKLRKKPEEVLALIHSSVRYARTRVEDVEWSAEDAGRSDRMFLVEAIDTAIGAGATTINLPDTVGSMNPRAYAAMIRYVIAHVRRRDEVTFSVHCHNDLGLATANSLAGIEAGARQFECTVNGIGERAGNAALEEIVMALKLQYDGMFKTAVNTRQLMHVSRLVSTHTGYLVQPNKAIIGSNAFSHASGIHQDGVRKHLATYEIMCPEDVGIATEDRFVLSQSSGRAGIEAVLERYSYMLSKELLDDIYARFLILAAQRRTVSEEELLALVSDRTHAHEVPYEVLEVQVNLHGNKGERGATAFITIRTQGVVSKHEYTSDVGEVDALLTCVQHAFNVPATLLQYHTHAIGEGAGALAHTTITISIGDKEYVGRATDQSTAIAALKAYTNALNRWAR